MAQTAATLASVLKERWSDDSLQKQWLGDDGIWNKIQSVKGISMGRQVQVPVWSDLNSGGYTQIGAGGGAINTASNQPTAQAVYTLNYQFFPINLEVSAINQSGDGGLLSVIGAKNFEVEGALETIKRQATRQIVTNGDSIVAQLATKASNVIMDLVPSPSGTAWGYDAIVRNWLRPGALIDVGTAADTDALATAVTVTGVGEVAAAPTVTTGTAVATTAGTHFIYIANPNSATAANPELNGLRNMVNTTGAIGGLNPATAGQEFWQAALRDTTTTVFSLDLALSLSRAVKQKSGDREGTVWTGLKQMANFYSLLQNQVRFAGDVGLGAGSWDTVKWNGMTVDAFPDVLDSDWWALTLSDLIRITGNITKPTWMTNIYGGADSPLAWHQGFTDGADALMMAFQTGMRRRNRCAGATGLTA